MVEKKERTSLKPLSFPGSMKREMNAMLTQTSNGAAAVIVIRLLCIKHTFVEGKEKREKGRRRK